ncbi:MULTISPECIES: hypothetical protein [unclassified Roseobacter]|uniref:hypothetical protein n=1 Tax=unclassified Roseobacter TaxID=196798 RepID=UPI001490C673|nr:MULTISPECIES: hypothetical protein [unclassified Roseobacter]NNW55476.1 hypothetical protein [Roseobacter sp. HKCCD8284]NNY17337.1 hypothetical protein [Roseobacter sp. HKCCD8191]
MTETTAEEYTFSAQRYVATQYIIIPHEDKFLLGTAYGQHRTYNGVFTAEELLTHLTEDFNHNLKNAEHQRKHAEAIAAERQARETTIASVENSMLNIKLDL